MLYLFDFAKPFIHILLLFLLFCLFFFIKSKITIFLILFNIFIFTSLTYFAFLFFTSNINYDIVSHYFDELLNYIYELDRDLYFLLKKKSKYIKDIDKSKSLTHFYSSLILLSFFFCLLCFYFFFFFKNIASFSLLKYIICILILSLLDIFLLFYFCLSFPFPDLFNVLFFSN